MIAIDWNLFGLGATAGAAAAVLFFAGLALGMRLALRSRRTTSVLLLSAALRIATLLGAGWLIAQNGAAALAGFALGFVAVRFAAIAIVRHPGETEASGCN